MPTKPRTKASAKQNYPREWLGGAYRMMALIRAFEERLAKLYAEGALRGSLHLCIGQEATAVGGCAALKPDDYMTCTYRGHGQSLAKGLSVRAAMAELMGKVTGCCKGRGGSMHLTDVSVGLLGENAIVAAGLPVACGAAFSAKMRKTGQVALTFFGEGATNQGVFHEALNLAAAWELPVVFFCENNVYAEMTPIAKEVKVERMAARAEGNGIPSMQVDGNDVLAAYETTLAAVERARSGAGPTFIEAHTYRLVGHMIGDPEVYRTKAEVEEKRADDPIARFRARLTKDFDFTADAIDALGREALAAVDDAEAFARSSPLPDPSTANDFIYA
ncbi:MAG: thiamine pyrophosphate-dependent dehydrogenase E1 component subunit alpha [Chloroflexi bacterium]|nr:thiamine pyrophosphate-dependent dehydrogenase E1 component subunit alpha [Chloroflexota bacterium]